MASTPHFSISTASSPTDLQEIRHLFTAYGASLKLDLSFQDFNTELSSLPGKYGPPSGILLMARAAGSGEAIGCVGVRPIGEPEDSLCEMKRLYCVPETRGLGVGRALVDEVLKRACALGYREMRLDTLPRMLGALSIYQERGFVEIEPYYNTPLKGTIFLAKKF